MLPILQSVPAFLPAFASWPKQSVENAVNTQNSAESARDDTYLLRLCRRDFSADQRSDLTRTVISMVTKL